MFRNSVEDEEKIYYDDPDAQLHTSLRFNDKNHPHQIYKTAKSNLRKNSQYFANLFDEFQDKGGHGIQRIEIPIPLSHESFDACMRFMCYTRFFTDENKRFDFDSNQLAFIYETAYYLEIEELKKWLFQKIMKGNFINKYSVWNFFALSVHLPTKDGAAKSQELQDIVYKFLKDKNFYSLKSNQFNQSHHLHNKIPVHEFKNLFLFHKEEKKKSKNQAFYLSNTDVVDITEHYYKTIYPNQEEFKENFKAILDEILDQSTLTEEEKLFLNNLDLFYILKEHKRFEEEAVHKYSMLAQRIEQLENQKQESLVHVQKKFERIDIEKMGVRTDLLSKLTTLEIAKAEEKVSLENRIINLEKENKDLKVNLVKIIDALQTKISNEKLQLSTISRTLRLDTNTLLLNENFRLFPGSKMMTFKTSKRLLKWVSAMGKDGILDSFGKMISLNTSIAGVPGSLNLIYQASRDGANAQSFHLKCDNVANTIVLIRTEYGNIFGGYTSNATWSSKGNYIKSDSKAFIFSLDHKIVMPIKDSEKAIYGHSNYGPTFGAGNEIFISKNFTLDQGSHTNINSTTYEKPLLDLPLKNESFLGGAFHFKISELEVFVLE